MFFRSLKYPFRSSLELANTCLDLFAPIIIPLCSFILLFCHAIKDFLPCIKFLASGMNRFGELERPALLPTGLALRVPGRLTEALERLELAGLALLLVGRVGLAFLLCKRVRL